MAMSLPPMVQSVKLETHTTASGEQVPLNNEANRRRLSIAYTLESQPTMTPVMCGFWLLALALDFRTETFKQVLTVTRRMYATYKDEGMWFELAMAGAMRIKIEQPTLFSGMTSAV